MKTADAIEFMNRSDWTGAKCEICYESLERALATRPHEDKPDETLVLCLTCAHSYDRREFKRTGVMSGSSLPTQALLRRDFETFAPFLAAEVRLTPTMQALWATYRGHSTLNHPSLKQAILVDTSTGAIAERTWGQEFPADVAAPGTVIVEIFDSMCGYYGIEIYQWGRANGMFAQGQIRSRKSDAWYRTCHADLAFVDLVNAAARAFLDAKPSRGRDWAAEEDYVRRQIAEQTGHKELTPGWLERAGWWPAVTPANLAYNPLTPDA